VASIQLGEKFFLSQNLRIMASDWKPPEIVTLSQKHAHHGV